MITTCIIKYAINKIFLSFSMVDQLYSYWDILQSIKSIKYSNNFCNELIFDDWILLDQVTIYESITDKRENSLSVIEQLYDEDNNIVDKYKHFWVFDQFNSLWLQNYEIQTVLKLMRKSSTYFNSIQYRIFSAEDLVNYTNPIYFAKGVNELSIFVQNVTKIPIRSFDNIVILKPKLLNYSNFMASFDNSSLIKLIIKLCEVWSLSISWGSLFSPIKLVFKNVSFMLKNKINTKTKIYFAKYFSWDIETDEIESWFYPSSSKPEDNKQTYIQLSMYFNINSNLIHFMKSITDCMWSDYNYWIHFTFKFT